MQKVYVSDEEKVKILEKLNRDTDVRKRQKQTRMNVFL